MAGRGNSNQVPWLQYCIYRASVFFERLPLGLASTKGLHLPRQMLMDPVYLNFCFYLYYYYCYY